MFRGQRNSFAGSRGGDIHKPVYNNQGSDYRRVERIGVEHKSGDYIRSGDLSENR